MNAERNMDHVVGFRKFHRGTRTVFGAGLGTVHVIFLSGIWWLPSAHIQRN